MTGWNLPPGVTYRMLDEAMGDDQPCAVCGRMEDQCICPECPACGAVGDLHCYQQHELPMSAFQIASLAEAEAHWAAEAEAEAEGYRKGETVSVANDDAAAIEFLRQTAIEMYLDEGYPIEQAQVLAKELLESEVAFRLPPERMLDQLVDAAIQGDYYTADGKRVMLPLKSLVDLGLVNASAVNRLKQRLDAWNAANPDTRDVAP